MVVYFDKTNLESYISSYSDERFSSTFKTIRNHLNVQFNFSKEEIKASDRSEAIMKFLGQLMQGRSNLNIKFDPEVYPERPVKSNLHSRIIHKPRAIMLLENEELSPCKEVGACVVGGVGEEVDTLNTFYLGNDGDGYDRKFIVGDTDPDAKLTCWDDLHQYTLPFYDLIISDRYILKCDEHTFRNNFAKFLEVMHKGRAVKTNIVLLTQLQDQMYGWTYEKIRGIVSEVTREATGKAANFTLVWSRDPDIIKHDRNIFTNYQWLFSGNSLIYFGANNSVLANGCTLVVSSLASKNNRKCAEGLLEDMQEGIEKALKNNPDMIQGDKKSNFLTF
jgi:hypothetical protein